MVVTVVVVVAVWLLIPMGVVVRGVAENWRMTCERDELPVW